MTAGGTAKISWVLRDILTKHDMNSSADTTNGWEATAMRTWLRGTILPTLSSDLQNAIKAVDKTFKDATSSSTKTVSDTLWIPSAREIFGGTSYEDSGCNYTEFFNSDSARSKKSNGITNIWWLRSAHDSSNFYKVSSNGYINIMGKPTTDYSVVLGFCT